ncbi:helix-turn-helix domain-containing protein [Hymenobacter elongatus]|uniref:XRE family transcriptional regulator n=1 Tax=Hymenobacter elongatus TaxID=877208 RepID=A0A4Z0PFF8_9BACT|nr:helix-turn-helix transcriptional regulator [Hymenobacter elongatus]TGE12249.1 XRE family transcriptional regulator [Hymenobacter elongatus]
MQTPTSFSETTAADVRRHFALTQTELGRWLGLSQAQVEAVEAGRRNFSPKAEARLARLVDVLPPAGPGLPAPEALPVVPPPAAQTGREDREAVLLRRRVRRCEHLAHGLGFQLETWALQDAAVLRRRQGLAALRLALAAPPAASVSGAAAVAEAVWLARLEAATAALPPRPGPLARAHLALRQRLLLAEAAELRRLLAAPVSLPPAPAPGV